MATNTHMHGQPSPWQCVVEFLEKKIGDESKGPSWLVGHGARHVPRRSKSNVPKVQVGWKHVDAPIEGIPNIILNFHYLPPILSPKSLVNDEASISGKDQEDEKKKLRNQRLNMNLQDKWR